MSRRKRVNRRQSSMPTGAAVRPMPPILPATPNPGASANGGMTNLSNGSMFPPGEPIRPAAGIVPADGAPRDFEYQVGYNIGQRPRATEQTSFEALRNLAALYDGVQLCERVYFDLIGRLELKVQPREELLQEGEDAKAPRWRNPAAIEGFLECPDRVQDLRSWLVAFTRDILEIDAIGVYRRRTRNGSLYGLELVAGDTLKPLIEEHGRTPLPPDPAYQQFVYGVPGGVVFARRAGLPQRDGAHRKRLWPLVGGADHPAGESSLAQAGLRPGAVHGWHDAAGADRAAEGSGVDAGATGHLRADVQRDARGQRPDAGAGKGAATGGDVATVRW
jgi:hypothetical protein